MNNLFDISSKIALVTGSGQGIGYTLAKGLANAGCTVVLNDIVEERLNSSVNKLKSEGYNAHGVVFDVTNEDQIISAVEKVKNEVGEIDILVNNAGIQIRGPLEDFKLDDWNKLLSINLTGAFLVSKSVVKNMMAKKAGKIINICSIFSGLG